MFGKGEKSSHTHPSSDTSSGDRRSGDDVEKEAYLEQVNTASTTLTSFEHAAPGNLYKDGQVVVCPAPTNDPRDPMNMTPIHLHVALLTLALFGALAMSAELILGAVLPVFIIQYSDLTQYEDRAKEGGQYLKFLTESLGGGFPAGKNPLEYLQSFGGPPVWQVYLLASAPILTIGLSSLILIPLAISIGRRPVILLAGVIAIAGAVWAGHTNGLGEHIGARVLQAFGAGCIESLIPFIVQDVIPVHKRNTYISMVFALQGLIIIGLGIATPYILVYTSWRWAYFITAIGSGVFLIGVFFTLPETRWKRSQSEMMGVPRPDHRSPSDYPQRIWIGDLSLITGKVSFKTWVKTWGQDLKLINGKVSFKKGGTALMDTMKTFFYPQIFFITMLNSFMISGFLAAALTISPALLTRPWAWDFLLLGLCLIPTIFAAVLVGILTGTLADKFCNWVAKARGRREPENQLVNLVLPVILAIIGSVIFGVSGDNPEKYHWITMLIGFAFMCFGFLGSNTVGTVYVLECYPQLAGPALVNIASFRWIFAFALSFKVADWVIELGYFKSMVIYTGLIAGSAVALPFVYVYGPAWRRRWPANRNWDD